MNITRSTGILGSFIGILGLAACSERTPFEPAADDAPAAVGATASGAPAPLLDPVVDPLLEVVEEIVSEVEVDEVFLVAGVDTLLSAPLLTVASNGFTPRFSTSSENNNTGWTSTTAQQTNPCTAEDITFNYKTRVQNKRKVYRDGTVRDETRVTSIGKGTTTAPIPGVRYFGYEDDYTRTYQGPKRNEDYQDQRTIYNREGNEIPDDDFHFHRRLRIVYDTNGNIVQVKTDQTKFECK